MPSPATSAAADTKLAKAPKTSASGHSTNDAENGLISSDVEHATLIVSKSGKSTTSTGKSSTKSSKLRSGQKERCSNLNESSQKQSGGSVTWDEEQNDRDASRKKIKRIVAVIGITFAVLYLAMVAMSLIFGARIDEMVEEEEKRVLIGDPTLKHTSNAVANTGSGSTANISHSGSNDDILFD